MSWGEFSPLTFYQLTWLFLEFVSREFNSNSFCFIVILFINDDTCVVSPFCRPPQYYERMSLSDALVPRFFKQGDCIIKQGDQADGMYFVQEGEVQVYKTNEDTGLEQEVTKVARGGYFGELALITKNPRAASVFAAANNVKCACKSCSLITQNILY